MGDANPTSPAMPAMRPITANTQIFVGILQKYLDIFQGLDNVAQVNEIKQGMEKLEALEWVNSSAQKKK